MAVKADQPRAGNRLPARPPPLALAAGTKPLAAPTATSTAAKAAVEKPIVKTAASAAPWAATRTTVKAEPEPVITALAEPKVDKLLKAKKPKLVRDSFTIPKLEYLILEELKQRASLLCYPIKKSELLRAGIKALAAMADADFMATLRAVPAIKTGRPAKN